MLTINKDGELLLWFKELAETLAGILGGYGLATNAQYDTQYLCAAHFFVAKDWISTLTKTIVLQEVIQDYGGFEEVEATVLQHDEGRIVINFSLYYGGKKYEQVLFSVLNNTHTYVCSLSWFQEQN